MTNTKRIDEEKKVIEKYGNLFTPTNIDCLEADDFKSFLLIRNNKHWDSIHRHGNIITRDMNKLRSVLKILLDESKPLKERFDTIIPKNTPHMIKGLGRATLTPILLVVYPDKYAVYNKVVENRMKSLEIFPRAKSRNFSETYLKINEIIKDLAKQNGLSLWQMDDVWWFGTTGKLPLEDGARR